MNTKQKLTLGIAAIFMVTLTIVGVTYAYFVTQVTGDTVESVQIQTASLGIKYQEGNAAFDVVDALPGETAYKTFSVINDQSTSPVSFAVGYEVKLPAANSVQFISSGDGVDVAATCYTPDAVNNRDSLVAEEKAKVASCYTGTAYNNVKISMYEYTGTSDVATLTDEQIEGILAKTGDDKEYVEVAVDQNVIKTTSADYSGTVTKLGANQTINGVVDTDSDGDVAEEEDVVKKYIVKVDYLDAGANQNIETTAALTFRMNISLPQ